MKRLLCFVISAVLFVAMAPVYANAESNMDVIYYEDGSYATVEIIETTARVSGSKTANKPYTYYNSNGQIQWKAVLTGTFSYTGSSATCTAASMSVTIYDSSWYTISKSATKSGNSATGSATIGEKVLGVTVAKFPVSLTLSCDANGNLS